MSTLSPKSLEGKYEVLGKLREGGMGAIYKVRHRLLNEMRVIKVMRAEVAQSADQRKRFLREAQTATRLRHPNIVAFFDFFVDEEDTAYMVMEYIEGINLRDTIREWGPFPVSLALDLSRQCLSAFDYLHRKGVVHRDVSPDNVMMTREEDGSVRAKLIDLGIAKIAQASEELTAADEFIGKLRYSSPEQLTSASRKIDSRSDLFSFGIVVYELLTGVRPYGGDNIPEIVTNRLNQPPLPFSESDVRGRLSPALRAAIMKALEKRPDDRYQSAAEFSKALESLSAAETSLEERELVGRYVSNALAKIPAPIPVPAESSDLPPTMRVPTRSGALGQVPDERDLQFQRTIAGWTGTTPLPSKEPATLRLEEAPRRSRPVAAYAGVAAAAAVLVAFGVWIAGRDAGRDPRAPAEDIGARTPVASSTIAGADVRPAPPAEPEPAPTAPAAGQLQPERASTAERNAADESAPPQPTARPRTRPTPPPRVAQVLPTKAPPAPQTEAGAAGKIAAAAPAVRMRYCPAFDDTVYKQGVVRDVPAGFEDIATKAPRPDSGLMKLRVSLSAERPLDDQPFDVIVRFENGGDARVDLQRLEESASRGGMRPVAGASVPVVVSPGGMKELHRYQIALSAGEPYSKDFRALDSKGDSWKTGFQMVPCAD